ncbi:uncharacterized protein LOC135384330 [Ornithodoros turicata]|uniref:uncharacterized protein LOC135384330 n=1 Tax=Ornithodoros turicata TaxID=34597 RepID=UPI003138EC90
MVHSHHKIIAPWLLSPPETHTEIPRIWKKAPTPCLAVKNFLWPTLSNSLQTQHTSTRTDTDGSSANGRSSSAFTVKGFTKEYRLSHATASTAADLHAILKALRHIDSSQAQKWVLCSDSKAALAPIIKQDTDDQMVYHIYKAYTSAVGKGHTISLEWTPSHCGIPGNEVVDQAAKDALGKTKLSAIPFTKSDDKTFLHKSTIRPSKKSWRQALRHTDFLSHRDPDLTAIIPHDIGRSLHTAIHRIRLGVPPNS